jgi:hypothetical protein
MHPVQSTKHPRTEKTFPRKKTVRDEMEARLNAVCDGKTLGSHSHNIGTRVNHYDFPPPSSFPTLIGPRGTFLRPEEEPLPDPEDPFISSQHQLPD